MALNHFKFLVPFLVIFGSQSATAQESPHSLDFDKFVTTDEQRGTVANIIKLNFCLAAVELDLLMHNIEFIMSVKRRALSEGTVDTYDKNTRRSLAKFQFFSEIEDKQLKLAVEQKINEPFLEELSERSYVAASVEARSALTEVAINPSALVEFVADLNKKQTNCDRMAAEIG